MADGTRIRSFEASIRKVEALLQQLQQIKAAHESNQRMEEQLATESDQQCAKQRQSDDVPSFHEEIGAPIQEIKAPIQEIKARSQEIESKPQFVENEVLGSLHRDIEEPKVTQNHLGARVLDGAFKERGESINVSVESIETKMNDSRVIAIELSESPFAHKVFVKMPSREVFMWTKLVDGGSSISNDRKFIAVLGPYERGKPKFCVGAEDGFPFNMEGVFSYCQDSIVQHFIFMPYDKEKKPLMPSFERVQIESWNGLVDEEILVFDPGGMYPLPTKKSNQCSAELIDTVQVVGVIWIFDPGISEMISGCHFSVDCSYLQLLVHWSLAIKLWGLENLPGYVENFPLAQGKVWETDWPFGALASVGNTTILAFYPGEESKEVTTLDTGKIVILVYDPGGTCKYKGKGAAN